MDFQDVIAWLRRLANLDLRVFEDIRSNPAATIPGVFIAFVSMVLAGLGGWLWWILQDYPNSGDILVNSAIIGALVSFILWGLWIVLVYVMLTQIFRERAYIEQLLRVMGLATAPIGLMVLMFIPGVSFAIGLAALVLTFGLTTLAVKTVTTADIAQTLTANLAGFFVWAAILTLVASSSATTFEPKAPGIFLYNAINSAFNDIADAIVIAPE